MTVEQCEKKGARGNTRARLRAKNLIKKYFVCERERDEINL
jgi:hypothetical protein